MRVANWVAYASLNTLMNFITNLLNLVSTKYWNLIQLERNRESGCSEREREGAHDSLNGIFPMITSNVNCG